MQHEKSNRDNLYMTSYAHHFEGERLLLAGLYTSLIRSYPGKSWEESKPLFDKLWDHLTQDKYILTVYWENDGDMVSTTISKALAHTDERDAGLVGQHRCSAPRDRFRLVRFEVRP